MPVTLIEVVEIIACLLLVLFVLMQPGSGGLGPALGGRGTVQVFGAHGASKILRVATYVCATIFVIATIVLAWFSFHPGRP